MARMIPSQFQDSTISAAERTVFYALQEGLDDRRWTVIHSLAWLDDRQRFLKDGQGECDFLLMNPEKGMLVLEVKSGTPRYDGRESQWYYEEPGRPPRAISNPVGQAQKASHYLDGLLRQKVTGWADQGLPFGYAVAFPDACNVLGAMPPEMSPEILILEPDLTRIQERVLSILNRFNVRAGDIDPEVFQGALDVLRPQFGLVPCLRTTLAAARREMVRLTEQQLRILEGMGRNSRMYVCGGAGTGKTLLIREQAKRLAQEIPAGEGPRVLVLCYNNSLESSLKEMLADDETQVEVLTFHALCRKLVETTGGTVHWPGSGDDHGLFWNEGLPEQAFDCLENFGHRYEAILVDEAQDFHSAWWVTVESLLAEQCLDGKDPKLFVFGDEKQDLYRRNADLPFSEPVYELTLNCRNTRQIAEWVHEAPGLACPKDVERLPDGLPVDVIAVEDAAAEVEAVRKLLHALIKEQGVEPGEIVILGRRTMERSSFEGKRKKLGNYEVVAEGEEMGPGCVQYSTIHKFKGLESDFVVLTGIGKRSEHYSEEDEKRFMYVGGSRARVGLFVVQERSD